MTEASEKHREAMQLAGQAEVALMSGQTAQAAQLKKRAFELEQEAAQLLLGQFDLEPTRSVLFRSAAALALECGDGDEAERLAAQGLAGRPPGEIAAELREVLEEATFRHHLSTRGFQLPAEGFQVSMAGPAISSGVARSDTVLGRVRSLEALVFRTAERKAGTDYRTSGRRTKEIRQNYEMFLGVPRAGSFALSIHLGSGQSSFPGLGNVEPIVDELFACIELFGSGLEDDLHKRITDDAYFANFISLVRRVAPDGDAVRWVGFTSMRGGKERHVELKSQAKPTPTEFDAPQTGVTVPPETVRVRGVIRWADALKGLERVRIVDSEGRTSDVRVPVGVDDIVKPFWLDEVVVTGRPGPRGSIILEDIELATDDD